MLLTYLYLVSYLIVVTQYNLSCQMKCMKWTCWAEHYDNCLDRPHACFIISDQSMLIGSMPKNSFDGEQLSLIL